MRLSLVRLFTPTFIMVAVTYCKHQNGASDIKHDFGAWQDMEEMPLTWVDIPKRDFIDQSPRQLIPYPDNHPRQLRLNEWMAAIHQEIKALNPNLIAPEPKVLLVKNPETNAFVSSAHVCLPVEVTFKNGFIPGKETKFDLVFNRHIAPMNLGQGPQVQENTKPCYNVKISEAELAVALKVVFADQYSCLSLPAKKGSDSYRTEFDLSCAGPMWSERLSVHQSAPRIRVTQIANQIVVHDALFDMSEGQLVSVLAHEAGHYYRAHGLSDKRQYNFFYRLDQKNNLKTRPKPLTGDEEIATLGAKLSGPGAAIWSLHTMPGQTFHSLVYAGLFGNTSILPTFCTEPNCTNACQEFAKHMILNIGAPPLTPLQGFPWQKAPNTDIAKTYYKTYEQLLERCTGLIAISADNELDIGSWFKKWPLSDQVEVREPLSEQTLLTAIKKISREAEAIIAERNSEVVEVYKKANAARLGRYTEEQEADELSLELMARLGIPAEEGITAYIVLSRSMEAEAPKNLKVPGKLTAAECEAAYKKGFPNFVPIADYIDSHHSPCFRSYNLWREAKAHADEMKAVKPRQDKPKLDSGLWQKLKSQRL